MTFDFKNGCYNEFKDNMNLRIIRKYRAADPGIRFLTKSISKPYGSATAMPPAWELSFY